MRHQLFSGFNSSDPATSQFHSESDWHQNIQSSTLQVKDFSKSSHTSAWHISPWLINDLDKIQNVELPQEFLHWTFINFITDKFISDVSMFFLLMGFPKDLKHQCHPSPLAVWWLWWLVERSRLWCWGTKLQSPKFALILSILYNSWRNNFLNFSFQFNQYIF